MKIARLPNSPSFTELLELTGELSVVMSELDDWHHNEIIIKLTETIDNNFEKIKEEFDLMEVEGWDEKHIRQCVAYSVLTSAETILTHVSMMERNLGLVTDNSPAEIAKRAFDVTQKEQFQIIATYWNEV
jgi:hypothetical protein